MFHGLFGRLAAASLTIAAAGPALGGDVDTHFDRTRARSAPDRNADAAPVPGSRTAVASSPAPESRARKHEPAMLVLTPASACTCAATIKAR